MKKILLIVSMTMTLFVAQAYGATHWGYSGAEAPENWAKLSPEFSACAGKNQSPINLTKFIEAELNPIAFSYVPGPASVINNGHTIQVDDSDGGSITLDGTKYYLKQFHFHAPSENLIDGKSYPLEVHLVHADKEGNLAVVAVMFTEGAENSLLAKIWPLMPHKTGDKKSLPFEVQASGLLPVDRDYFRYNGSLTTPPCTEGVVWLVMKTPLTASKSQIEEFSHLMHHPNNRPVQPVNARPVLQ